ncbi:MAG: calcium/sodium antiporter [Bacteroidaceae bacterium]|nr:calcium/sodium antiporter [Bacteroidaceae bacterium]
MLLLIIKLILSLAAIIIGADWMTNGASAVAVKMHIKPFIVGLTIVAMGTSAPELFVSVSSALESISSGNPGMGDIAIGNVVGSNIFNNLLIIGSVSLIAPLTVSKITVKRDLPIVTLASAALFLFLLNGSLSRIEGTFFCVCFLLFMWMTVRSAKENGDENESTENVQTMALWKAIICIIVGLGVLVFASDLFVDYASDIATNLNVSEKIVGLTIVGAGTSAPELATSVMAARKGQGEMAIGNVIGSNIFNILMILGLTGLIQPLEGITINYIDLSVLILAALLFWLFSFTKYKLERWEGAVLLALCAGYITWLIYSS